MTNIENYISIAKRTGYTTMPVDFQLCPSLQKRFDEYVNATGFEFQRAYERIPDIVPKSASLEEFSKFYPNGLKEGTAIDIYGVAREKGSQAAHHMTKMLHPMEHFDSAEQIAAYPLPDFAHGDATKQIEAIKHAHANDMVAMGRMSCTVWEGSWFLRGMENLMTDMMLEDPMAEILLDRMTDGAVIRAESYARNGVDVLLLGDDVGMQRTLMMSESLYCTWLKPRLKRVIEAAKRINPNLIVFYHSCGFITPLIPHLIEVGIDVLNPVQPECMSFEEIHDTFGDRLSFHGTIGTQTTMPYGSPEDVRNEVFKNLEIAGEHGGLYVAPTHLLEPDVPVENVVAYINACRDFKV